MIFFLLSVLCSTLVSVLMRASEKHISNNFSMLACNYIVCTIVAGIVTGTTDLFPAVPGSARQSGWAFFPASCFWALSSCCSGTYTKTAFPSRPPS